MAHDLCDAVVRILGPKPKSGQAVHVETCSGLSDFVDSVDFVCELSTPEKPTNAMVIEDITGDTGILNVITRRVRNP